MQGKNSIAIMLLTTVLLGVAGNFAIGRTDDVVKENNKDLFAD